MHTYLQYLSNGFFRLDPHSHQKSLLPTNAHFQSHLQSPIPTSSAIFPHLLYEYETFWTNRDFYQIS